MADNGKLNPGLDHGGEEENCEWGEGVYVQMRNSLGFPSKEENTPEQDSDYLEINDAGFSFEMGKLNEEHCEENTYANVAEELVKHNVVIKKEPKKKSVVMKKSQQSIKEAQKLKEEITEENTYANVAEELEKSNVVIKKEPKKRYNVMKKSQEKKQARKSHLYSLAKPSSKKPVEKHKNQSLYSYASPDFAPGNSLEKKESQDLYLKPCSDSPPNAGSIGRGKFRPDLATTTQTQVLQPYVEPFDKLSCMDEQNYALPNETHGTLNGSNGHRSLISPSSFMDKQGSLTTAGSASPAGTKRKRNLMYEKTDPSGKKINQTVKETTKFQRHHITGSKVQWRAFIVIITIMVVLTSVMLAFQVLGMFKKCCQKGDQEYAVNMLKKRTTYIEAQMAYRVKEISVLKRITDNQKIQIQNLQSLIKLVQLQHNQTKSNNLLRKRRSNAETLYKIQLGKQFLKQTKRNTELEKKTTDVNSYLTNKVTHMKLTPGPKGIMGPRGHYSFVGCTYMERTNNNIIQGDVNKFAATVEAAPPQSQTVTSAVCSSPYALRREMSRNGNTYKCKCVQADAQQLGKSIECKILLFICPTLD